MSTQIKNKKPTHPPIYALAILGPRAMKAIDRHKSIAAIAVHEASLGPKVSRFAAPTGARGERDARTTHSLYRTSRGADCPAGNHCVSRETIR